MFSIISQYLKWRGMKEYTGRYTKACNKLKNLKKTQITLWINSLHDLEVLTLITIHVDPLDPGRVSLTTYDGTKLKKTI